MIKKIFSNKRVAALLATVVGILLFIIVESIHARFWEPASEAPGKAKWMALCKDMAKHSVQLDCEGDWREFKSKCFLQRAEPVEKCLYFEALARRRGPEL